MKDVIISNYGIEQSLKHAQANSSGKYFINLKLIHIYQK